MKKQKNSNNIKNQEENNDLSLQITHEVEITRQNARFKIPVKIEIDGKIYTVKDWSLTGCAITDLPKSYEGKFVIGKMIFKFDQFETIIDNIKIDCLHSADTYIGCRFSELTPQQLAILNQIISAYINGDILTQDDIITAVTKIQMYPKKKKIDKVEEKKAKAILLLIFITIVILLSFLSYVIYKKIFIIESINGYIDSNITTLRNPYPSFIKFQKNYKKDDNISQGETVAIAYLIGGGISTIIAPVNGKVFQVEVKNQEFRDTGEPILSVLDRNSTNYIRATLNSKEIEKIKIGYIAKIILNKQALYGKIIKILYPENVSDLKGKPNANIYSNPNNYVQLIIIPFEKIDNKWIGSSVYVKIDTFINQIGYINEKNTHNFFTTVF